MKAFLQWLPAISFAANLFLAWAVWSMRELAKREVTAIVEAAEKRLSTFARETQDQVDDHEARLARIEEGLKHVATAADVRGLQAEIRGLEGRVERVGEGVARIEQYLLERSAR